MARKKTGSVVMSPEKSHLMRTLSLTDAQASTDTARDESTEDCESMLIPPDGIELPKDK